MGKLELIGIMYIIQPNESIALDCYLVVAVEFVLSSKVNCIVCE